MDSKFPRHRKDSQEDVSSYIDHHRIPYQRLKLNSVKHKELQVKLLNSTRLYRIWKTDRVFPVKPIPVETCSVIENNFASHFEPRPHTYSRFRNLKSAYHVTNQDCIDEVNLPSTKTYETSQTAFDCNLVGKSRLSDCNNFEKLSKLVSSSDVLRQKNYSVELQHIEEKSHESNKSEERFIPKQQEMRLIGYHTTENHSTNCSDKFERPTARSYQKDSDKPYQCDVCNERFRRRDYLNQHKLIHTDEKPYECNVCNKRFRQWSQLYRHKPIHTGEKPYQCKVCNKRFRLKQNLYRHSLIHTDEKPYQCDVCNKRFRRVGTLNSHMRTHTRKTSS